jgi:putative peptidoglycan lipid II flippase
MTLALLPSLHASGFRYRPRLDLHHPGLRQAGRLASWVFVYVGVSQLSYFVVTRLATRDVAFTTYSNAYQLFQLPHAIIAVSLITALLPRMSSHAADARLDLVREDLSLGLRMSAVILVPAALGMLALAQPLAVTLFAHGATSVSDASRIGAALAAFSFALLPFSAFQLQLRAFYAMADSRTPALVMCAVAAVNIASGLLFATLMPSRDRAVALALAFALSYAVGAAICFRLLSRRLHGVEGARLARTLARAGVAAALAAGIAYGMATLFRSVLGSGFSGSVVGLIVGGLLGIGFYAFAAFRMTEELRSVTTLASVRFRRR